MSKFRITLPFEDCSRLPRSFGHRFSRQERQATNRALKQTKKRWCWFVRAQRLDTQRHTRLGTLGYLPQEVRELIYKTILGDHITKILYWDNTYHESAFEKAMKEQNWSSKEFSFDPGHKIARVAIQRKLSVAAIDMLDLEWHHVGLWGLTKYGRAFPQNDLRLASRTLKGEFDDYLLRNSTFCFDCPHNFRRFMRQLFPTQVSCLRRITINVYGDQLEGCCLNIDYHREWTSAIDGVSPLLGNLTRANLNIGSVGRLHRLNRCRIHDWCLSESIKRDVWANPAEPDDVVKALELLAILKKEIRGLAPSAEIAMPLLESSHEQDRAALISVLKK